MLQQAGIVEAELRNPDAWLELDRMAALYEAAATELDDAYFGLAFGATLPLKSFGLLSYVVLNASDVETALRNLARYSAHLSITGVAAGTAVEGEVARLVFTLGTAEALACRQYFEGIAAVLCVMMKALAGSDWRPREVCFEHEPAASPTEVARRLEGPVRFGAVRHSIAFDAADLGRAVPGADRSLLPVIEKHVNDVIGPADVDPLVARIRDELARTLCDGKPDIRTVARRLAMSPRTLQRRLNERGVRYKSLVNETRAELAKEYLVQGGPAVTEIAFLLGYGELSAFDRAFRRETGLSPTVWRSTQRERG